MKHFTDLDLLPPLAQALHEIEFHEMTPVQAAGLPAVLAGRDVLERALQTHARLAAVRVAVPDGARQFPSLAILRSGDVVSCAVEAMDGRGMRLRTPVADAGAETAVTVAARPCALWKAISARMSMSLTPSP